MGQSRLEQAVANNTNWINSVISKSKLTSQLSQELATISSLAQKIVIQEDELDAKYANARTIRGYRGNWSADTNTPILSNSSGVVGDVYKVSIGGNIDIGSGSINYVAGDLIYLSEDNWIKISPNQISDITGLQLALDALADGLIPQGTWDATLNDPDIDGGTAETGYFWIVSVAGSTDVGGITDWEINDWAVKTATGWAKIDNTDKVLSVAGRTGIVVLSITDITGLTTALANCVKITTAQDIEGEKTFKDDVRVYNGNKLLFGTSDDLKIYHDGIKGYIKNITGVLNLESNNIEIGTFNNSATGLRSIAMGANTTASNTDAIAMGENTTATGISSTAIGKATNASGNGATSMGNGTTASGVNSTSMGVNTLASGDYSTSIGNDTTASGDNSFSAGALTIASGERSTATGNTTLASGVNSTATGINTIASGNHSTAMGNLTLASGNHSIAMGNNTTSSGTNSISAGSGSTAGGNQSFAVGFSTTANGNVAIAMGNSTVASGTSATAMGLYSVASGVAATATGYDTEASGANSTAMGKETTASGLSSFATGDNTTASGDYSTALGRSTFSTGLMSFALGYLTRASGEFSIAMGSNSTASGYKSISIGDSTIANSMSEIAIGRHPVAKTGNATGWVATDRLFSIGNGGSAASPSMALEILKNGITVLPAVVSLSFADDTAAATGGVPVGGLYHTSGAIKIRLT
jgi:hypothetical protein